MDTACKRLLTDKEAASYVGLGVTAFRIWAEKIGCIKRFGRRRLNDKLIIDQMLNDNNSFSVSAVGHKNDLSEEDPAS